jgi:hypothetical protein
MAKFITTIQLLDADERDYEILNSELEKELFKAEEHAAKSDEFISERGSFSREGNITLQEVTESLTRVVPKIGKKFSFSVIRNKNVTSSIY